MVGEPPPLVSTVDALELCSIILHSLTQYTGFLAAGTDGNNAGASVLGMEVPAAVSTGGTVAGSVLGAGTAAAPVELDDVPSVARAAARRLTYEDSDLTFQPPAITDCVKHNNQLVQYAVIVLPSGTNVLGGLKYFVNPEDLSELVVAVQMPPLMGNARAIHGDMLKDMNPQEQNNHIRVSNYLDVLQGMRPSSGGWPWFHATIKLPLECLTGTFTRNQLYQQADGTKVLCLDMLVEDGTTAKKLGVKNVEDDFEDEPHAVFDA